MKYRQQCAQSPRPSHDPRPPGVANPRLRVDWGGGGVVAAVMRWLDDPPDVTDPNEPDYPEEIA